MTIRAFIPDCALGVFIAIGVGRCSLVASHSVSPRRLSTGKDHSAPSVAQSAVKLPFCNGTQYAVGEWVPRLKRVKKRPTFTCCDYDPPHGGDNISLNQEYQYAFGCSKENYQWLYKQNCTGITNFQMGGSGCFCRKQVWGHNHSSLQAPLEEWVWKPLICKLPTISGAQFCKALGNRKLLFVGDSTMAQWGL